VVRGTETAQTDDCLFPLGLQLPVGTFPPTLMWLSPELSRCTRRDSRDTTKQERVGVGGPYLL
jgi:hypothetical protein